MKIDDTDLNDLQIILNQDDLYDMLNHYFLSLYGREINTLILDSNHIIIRLDSETTSHWIQRLIRIHEKKEIQHLPITDWRQK